MEENKLYFTLLYFLSYKQSIIMTCKQNHSHHNVLNISNSNHAKYYLKNVRQAQYSFELIDLNCFKWKTITKIIMQPKTMPMSAIFKSQHVILPDRKIKLILQVTP